MKIAARLLLGLLVFLVPTAAATAHSASGAGYAGDDSVVSWEENVTLSADGTAHVTLNLTMDFGVVGNHGPYLTFVEAQPFDDTYNRIYQYSNFTVSSPSGAPSDVGTESNSGILEVKIGDPDVGNIVGQQQYVLDFDIKGLINPESLTGDGDQLYWNILGSAFELPIGQMTVQITGPADITDAACFATAGQSTPCEVAHYSGHQATLSQSNLAPYTPFTVAVKWPGGTYPGVQPILRDNNPIRALFAPNALNIGTGAAALVGGLALMAYRLRKHGSDEQYLGLTPGLQPASNQQVSIGRRVKAPVAVQFTPPQGFQIADLGTLLDESADMQDISAQIVDLAIRGQLRIDPLSKKNFRLTRLGAPTGGLSILDTKLLAALFKTGDVVDMEDLDYHFSQDVAKARELLYQNVTDAGLFKHNPMVAKMSWFSQGFFLLLLAGGIIALAVYKSLPLGILGAAIGLVGVVWVSLVGRAPARTAKGTAVLDQLLGFRTYMATAEANQIRFEEGQDVFSKYLPYAMVFGLTERWTRIFAQLAAQGIYTPSVYWYGGGWNYAAFADGSFNSSMSSFAQATNVAMTHATPGSGGGSGFGGGGFGGGGVGGGGGGSW